MARKQTTAVGARALQCGLNMTAAGKKARASPTKATKWGGGSPAEADRTADCCFASKTLPSGTDPKSGGTNLQHGVAAPGVTSFSFTVSLSSTARLTYPLPLSRVFVEGFLQRRSNSKHRTVPIHRRRSITPSCVRPIKSDLIPMETLLDTAVRS